MGYRGADIVEQERLLVGRQTEAQTVDHALRVVTGGSPACLAFVGEPGIGKTALVRETCRRSELAGLDIASGRGTEYEREAPFGVFVNALDATLASMGQDWLVRLGPERLGELATVFPALSGLGKPAGTALQAERYRFHYAVHGMLEKLVAERPMVLALDDAHWADDASVELMAHLLRRGVRGPLLMVLAYRPRQAPAALLEAVGAAVQERSVAVIDVAPLARQDAEALLADVPPERSDALYREAGGNPFYLGELSRALAAGEDVQPPEPPADESEVPFAVRAAISREMRSLSGEARTFAEAAAVVGEPFELEMTARAASIDVDAALEALDELLAGDILRATDLPTSYVFRHPIVRRAVYESASAAFRIAAHARTASALEERGAPPAALAHHVERSARNGDERAVEVLASAAQAVAPRAPATAARWFAAALRLLPGDAPATRRVTLLVDLATTLGNTARVDDSRAALAEALALVPRDQPARRGQLVGAMARLDHAVGRHGQARALFDQVLADAGPDRTATLALRLELAMDHWFAAEWSKMVVAATTAHDDAEALGDEVASALALGFQALGHAQMGTIVPALEQASAAATAVDALPDVALATHIEALLVLGHAEFLLERSNEGTRHIERGIAISRTSGEGAWFGLFQCFLCSTYMMQGRLTEALAAAEAALDSSRLGHHTQPQVWALTLRCWILTLQGDLEAAVRDGDEAVGLLRDKPTAIFAWLAYACRAMATIESGDPARGRSELLAHVGGPDLTAIDAGWQPRWFQTLSAAALTLGDDVAAEYWVGRAEAAALAYPLPGRRASGRHARAALEFARNNHEQAVACASDAARDYASAHWRIDAARAQIIAGRALAALGHRDEAIERLREAYGALDACGARRYADEAARDMRRLGHRIGRRGRRGTATAGIGYLSEREREVAELVAQGMTNRQIAELLFLSPRTVETHVAHIFEKLNVSSRASLAHAVASARWPR